MATPFTYIPPHSLSDELRADQDAAAVAYEFGDDSIAYPKASADESAAACGFPAGLGPLGEKELLRSMSNTNERLALLSQTKILELTSAVYTPPSYEEHPHSSEWIPNWEELVEAVDDVVSTDWEHSLVPMSVTWRNSECVLVVTCDVSKLPSRRGVLSYFNSLTHHERLKERNLVKAPALWAAVSEEDSALTFGFYPEWVHRSLFASDVVGLNHT